MAVEITVVDNENINITIESGGASSFNPAADVNFTGTNVQRNGVAIATVNDITPFDLAADYDTTGEWSYDITGQVQQLMTDDPTYQAMTYVFATTDDGLIAPDIVYDIRQTDVTNTNGYESSREKLTGNLSTKITSKTAEISTSYDASLQDSIAKVYANGKGMLVTDTGTGTTVSITADSIPTINNAVIATMGTTTADSLLDTYESPVSDLTSFKTLTWLTAYNYIKSKLSAAGYIYLTTDTFANINTNFPPANYSGCIALATDIDSNDSTFRAEFYSDGSIWRPVNGEIVLSGCKYPVIDPSGGSVADGGIVTFTTTLTLTYGMGIWVYLPNIGTTPAITAGYHFVIMSSATAGQIYGDGGGLSLPTNTPSGTALVTSGGTQSYTGDVNEKTMWSWTIPAGLLSDHGSNDVYSSYARNASGSQSIVFSRKLGTSTVSTGTNATANLTGFVISPCKNNGPAYQAKVPANQTSTGFFSGAPIILTENTAVAVAATITSNKNDAAPNDWGMLLSSELRLKV